MIAQGFLQDLLSRLDIVDVVGRRVELKKAGINHKGLCPFHGEKTPSFIVSPTRQSYHCFGCGAHGDAIRFVSETAGLGFVDAVHELAQQAGLKVPDDASSAQDQAATARRKAEQATLADVLARAAAHYQTQLKAAPHAIEYLKRRGLSGDIAARFGLGYAPAGWRALASVFPKYDDRTLVDAGLVIVQGDDEAEQKRYDRFRDRIMFPIRAVQGDVIGFGGRVIDGGEPKYLNSPETPLFVKGRELYGLHEARQAIRERGFVLVVEGYMDVVALAQLGFPNAVATLGTACTEEHVRKLFRFTDSVVFSFDGDAAGRRAAARALEASLPHANDVRNVRFLFLPPEHDPDSFVRAEGSAAFERCIERAVPLSRQLIDSARDGCEMTSPEGRSRFLAQAKPLWLALPDAALRRQIAGEIAVTASLHVSELLSLWRPSQPPSIARQRSWGGARRLPAGAATLLDRGLWLLVCRCELWDTLDAASHDLLVEQPAPYGPAFGWLERYLHEHGTENAASLLRRMEDEDLGAQGSALVRRLAALHDNEPGIDLQQQLQIVLDRLRLQAVEDELKLLFESGELSEQAAARARDLHQRRVELKRLLMPGA